MKNFSYKMTGGYSLVEAIFYVSIFTILSLVIINSLSTMTRSFQETSIKADLVQSSLIMERISREIRQASSINNITATSLKLNTENESGDPKKVEFVLSGSDVGLLENDVLIGNLNTTKINVTDLSFTEVTTSVGVAVKISVSVVSTRDIAGNVETFYDTVSMRGAY